MNTRENGARLMTLIVGMIFAACGAAAGDSISTQWEAGVTPYVDHGATALDNVDGDITDRMATTGIGQVNVGVPGSYTVSYTVSDAAGNPAVPGVRTVIVKDTTIPVITLVGAASMTIAKGTAYVDPGANASDLPRSVTCPVTIAGAVNTAVLGTYTRTYDAADPSGNKAVQKVRTVIVINPPDAIPPVITVRP